MRGESSPLIPLRTPEGLTTEVIVAKLLELKEPDGLEKFRWLRTLKAWQETLNTPPSQ